MLALSLKIIIILTKTGLTPAPVGRDLRRRAMTITSPQVVTGPPVHMPTAVRVAELRATQSSDVTRLSQTPNKSKNPENPILNSCVSQQDCTFYNDISLPWPCPIDSARLSVWLQGYDPIKASFLIQGLVKGFEIHSSLQSDPSSKYTNHRSAYDNYDSVQAKLNKELASSRIAGPFDFKPPGLIISPLAAVPKKDTSEIRIIHDLSFPLGNSVNSHIPRDHCRVEYELLDNCLEIILGLGRGCLMAKADIKSAFRILPIAPSSYHLLGFTWGGSTYVDKSLPMGLSSACAKFESFSSAIQWILVHKLNVQHMSHILDDFLFFGLPSSRECHVSLQAFLRLAKSINVPIKAEKTVHPTTSAQLHGLLIDTNKMAIILPEDKKLRAVTLLQSMSTR